ncbi:MAG: hypothetical protein ACRDOD_20840 [Streptosporangiaceae bacterium]
MACYGPKSCVGLGQYTPSQSSEYYLQTWNGTAWGAVFAPMPGSENDSLYALSCASARFCVAAGSTSPAEKVAPLAATWNGTRWSVSKPPEPKGSPGGAFFNGISCASATFCVAVGDYTRQVPDSAPETEGFADTWNGRKWTISRQLRPKNRYVSYLGGVSCRSARSCVAVGGSYADDVTLNLYATPAVAETELWNGRKWTAARPPAAGHEPVLEAVSCASARSCLAVGVGNNNAFTGPIRGIADSWNGHAWKAVAAAVPSHGGGRHQGDALDDVGCAAPADCVALGAAGPYQGSQVNFGFLFAERWNGKSLKLMSDS